MRRVVFKARFLWIVLLAMIVGGWPMAAQAAVTPSGLGTAANFAILAGTAVTCTNSTVTGNVGVSPGATVTGFPPCAIINGTIHANDLAAMSAHTAFLKAYNQFKALHHPCGTTVPAAATYTGTSITLPTGVSCFGAALTMTTETLTLTGPGPWYIEIGTGGTGGYLEATNVKVVSSNPCNVFWWVHDYATITVNPASPFGTSTPFQGTILAGAAATLTGTTSAPSALTLTGRVLAQAAVTVSYTNILGCTAAGTVPGTKCKPGTSTDADENAEQSKDTGDNSNKSVSSAAAGASQSSKDDGKDENGKHDSDEGNKGCKSDNSHDNSNKDKKS
jgi:hypothetical protein